MPAVLDRFVNEASTTLAADISAGATSLTVASATGFPTQAQYRIRVTDSRTSPTKIEYMIVTGGAGTTTWTVTRGAEAPYSTGLAFTTGAFIDQVVTAGSLQQTPVVNALAYGVRPNSGLDDTTNLQAFLNACEGRRGFIPAGEYLVSDTLLQRIPSEIEGELVTPNASLPAGFGVMLSAAAGMDKHLWRNDNNNDPGDWYAHGGKLRNVGIRAAANWRPPGAGTPSTATTGGSLAAGTYSYRVTATTAVGETRASMDIVQVTTGATSTVTVNWTAPLARDERTPPAVTGYRVYGRTRGTWRFIASVGAGTLTYTDTGSITPDAAQPMNEVNTSGQRYGSGIKWVGGENSAIDDVSANWFPEAGIHIRRDIETTLAAAVTTTSQTAWTVASGANIVNGDVLQVDAERVTVTAGGGTTSLTVTRASYGTTAATHVNGRLVYNQKTADSAPMLFRNLHVNGCRFGVHLDQAAGPHTIEGITGDDNNSMIAVTNNATGPNEGGGSLQVIVVGAKAEVSPNTSTVGHNPWLYINNGNECQVQILGGRITDNNSFDPRYVKALVEIENGWNGFASTRSAIVRFMFPLVTNYQHLLIDRVAGEVIPWYTGDDNPDYRRVGEFSYRGLVHFRSDGSVDPLKVARVRGPKYPTLALTQTPATTLTANVTTAATTISVASATNFPPAGTSYNIRVDREVMTVTGGQGTTTWTVTRGVTGSLSGAEEHVAASPIVYENDVYLMAGQGNPEGLATANPGSLYAELLPGSNNPSLYFKDSGVGNTGWGVTHGWEFLGATMLAGAATTTAIVPLPLDRAFLQIVAYVSGFSATAIPSLRFGTTLTTVDSGANYQSRTITAAAGAATLADNPNVSATSLRIGGVTGTVAQLVTLTVYNRAAVNKLAVITGGLVPSGAVGTASALVLGGGGEWVNTSSLIKSVQLLSVAVTANLNANSGLAVFGRNIA